MDTTIPPVPGRLSAQDEFELGELRANIEQAKADAVEATRLFVTAAGNLAYVSGCLDRLSSQLDHDAILPLPEAEYEPGPSPSWAVPGECYTTSVTVRIPDPEPGHRHIAVTVRSEDENRLRELTGAL